LAELAEAARKAARWRLKKRVIRKADGRYLILYQPQRPRPPVGASRASPSSAAPT